LQERTQSGEMNFWEAWLESIEQWGHQETKKITWGKNGEEKGGPGKKRLTAKPGWRTPGYVRKIGKKNKLSRDADQRLGLFREKNQCGRGMLTRFGLGRGGPGV